MNEHRSCGAWRKLVLARRRGTVSTPTFGRAARPCAGRARMRPMRAPGFELHLLVVEHG